MDSFSFQITVFSVVEVEIRVTKLLNNFARGVRFLQVEIFALLLIVLSNRCSRIYHVFSNLLGMLRKIFMALSLFYGSFKDAHVPMPDISGYIRERVKASYSRMKSSLQVSCLPTLVLVTFYNRLYHNARCVSHVTRI